MIFVFGSNESGIHGAGAARFALKEKGAVLGVGWGLQGESFALPTKDWDIRFMSIDVIRHYVDRFVAFAKVRSGSTFQVTRVGCGLGGWTDVDIAPLFADAPDNCLFDSAWAPLLGDAKRYWGTF